MEPLLVERNNQTGKIVNGLVVYNLHEQPKIGLINFTSKNCLFGVIAIVKNSDKSTYVYCNYGLAFDG